MGTERSSGILLHPTSLPGGRLNREAYAFLDWLAAAGQSWWQVLPLGPPDAARSPYRSASAFAGWRGLLAEPHAPVSAGEIEAFSARKGRLPANLEELFGPEGSSRFDAQPWDSWHKPFEYRVVDAAKGDFRLRSYGPDKTPDTSDDIVWPKGASWR